MNRVRCLTLSMVLNGYLIDRQAGRERGWER